MRSSLVVRASDCQCTSCNGPGFDPSIRRHTGIWGAADEAVLNNVRTKRKKSPKKYLEKIFTKIIYLSDFHTCSMSWRPSSLVARSAIVLFLTSSSTILKQKTIPSSPTKKLDQIRIRIQEGKNDPQKFNPKCWIQIQWIRIRNTDLFEQITTDNTLTYKAVISQVYKLKNDKKAPAFNWFSSPDNVRRLKFSR